MEKAEKDNTVQQRMQDILLCVSWREIANTYFDAPHHESTISSTESMTTAISPKRRKSYCVVRSSI
jgi:hypothetical protein